MGCFSGFSLDQSRILFVGGWANYRDLDNVMIFNINENTLTYPRDKENNMIKLKESDKITKRPI